MDRCNGIRYSDTLDRPRGPAAALLSRTALIPSAKLAPIAVNR